MSNMFDIPKKWCPGYEEVGGPPQVPHLLQCLCPKPPSPPPSSWLLDHWGGCKITPLGGGTDHKTYKQTFMSNVSNTYLESHVFLVCGGALEV